MFSAGRATTRIFCLLCAALLLPSFTAAEAPGTTPIRDYVYRADGVPVRGHAVISWPAFTTADQKPIPAGSLTVQLGDDGRFDAALAPNIGATPDGSSYKVVFHLEGALPSTENWLVPAAAETTISAIRATVMPASAAVQVASRSYVDAALAGKAASGANADITSLALGNGDPWLQRDAPDALALWRGSTPQRFSVYNTRADAANFERLSASWTPEAAFLHTESAGSGAARPLLLGAGDSPSFELQPGKAIASGVLSADGYLDMSGTAGYAVNADPPAFGGTGVGWKLGLWQNIYAIGIANNTVALKSGKWFSVFNANPANDSTSSVPDSQAGVSLGGDGTLLAKNINGVRYADQFAGSDACAKIAAAIADLPSTGGTVDARGLSGAQICTGLTIGTGQTVMLGAAVLTTTGTITVTGNGARLIGLPPNLPGNGTAQNTSSVLKLASSAASGTAVVNVRNASNATVENLGIDANSVANAIGVRYDSTAGHQGSTHGTFRNLDIRNAHQCFVDGDPSETATANSKQADYFVLDNWTCFGNGTDLTAEGFHINNGWGGEASVVSRGGIGVVNKGIHIVLGGAYARYEGNTSTSGVGTNAEFISLDATAHTGGLFINNHTENTGWTYAFRDASCGDGGSHLGYNRPVVLMNNHWGHPVLVDGCNSDISIGNVGSSGTVSWTVGGTASVQSVGDTIYLTTTLPWTVSGSGQVYRWGQDGKLLTNNITFTTGSSQLTTNVANGLIDLNALGTGKVRIGRMSGTGGFEVDDGAGAGTVVATIPATGPATFVNGVTLGGGSAITKHLSTTATLDFPNTPASTCADLTAPLAGASPGDSVSLGVPNASVPSGGFFSAWVSAANTVTIRFCALTTGNPASGSFRLDVWKH